MTRIETASSLIKQAYEQADKKGINRKNRKVQDVIAFICRQQEEARAEIRATLTSSSLGPAPLSGIRLQSILRKIQQM